MSVVNKLEKSGDFPKFLEEHKSRLVVLFFSANWSDECKLMSNVISELAKDEKNRNAVRFLEIEAEDNEELSIKYGVEAVPSFVFIKNNAVAHKLSGADAPELRKKLDQVVQTLSVVTNVDSANGQSSLEERLKKLINQAPVVVFMKGSPQVPRCGFGTQLVNILKSENVTYSYFDILSDNEVREGLKKFSNWPTYPQVYIKGELVGGLDIIKELVNNGEFQSMVPKPEENLNEKLKKLTHQSKIMLFMKGNAREPKCGFSRQIVEILNETGLKYDSFDILSDDEVRQGLKEFSKWPTYPQLYVDGELVGGLDIVKELKTGGELEETLKGKQ